MRIRVGYVWAVVVAVGLCAADAALRAQGAAAGGDVTQPAPMAKDADPDFEVLTVRPSDLNETGSRLMWEGREFVIKLRPVDNMLQFGYALQKRQVVNAPDWFATDLWDVTGLPDAPGDPSLQQMQSLTRKLLVERFGLKFHTEQREMEVYALTVGKGGPKLERSKGDPNGLPNENDRENGGQITMQMQSVSMSDLALQLKSFMDRPVVDKTGLAGRYDFQLKWTADEMRAPTDGSAAPSVFTAVQEQLGLKLEPVKAMTDVMVVDKVQRPGAN